MANTVTEPLRAPHKLSLENRGTLTVTGVEDVESFDEQAVILLTGQGALVIRGSGLHLRSLSLEGGSVIVEGSVDALTYEQKPTAGGFFSRLLR